MHSVLLPPYAPILMESTRAIGYSIEAAIADIIDNCKCIGNKIEADPNDPDPNTNTRQWCICMQDTSDYSIEHLISSWKSIFKGKLRENRDSVIIDKLKAIRVIFISENKNDPFRELIYLKRKSVLLEFINIYLETSKDFETFYKSVRIEDCKKPCR